MYDHAFRFPSPVDGLELQVYVWHACTPRKGSVLIAHGFAEHAQRYDRFAAALAAQGLEVVAFDHRGHGRSPGPDGVGDYGKGGWASLVSDVGSMLELVRETHTDLPVALFGHSMGSFAAQRLCHDRSERIDALVLSGSTAFEPPHEGEPPAPLDLNAAFEPARTPYDWLSRDAAEVDRYVADPLCGFEGVGERPFTYADLFELSNPVALKGLRADLSVLLLAGEADPLNRGLRGLHQLERLWREAGVARIDTRYYPGGRHEMLNELNREEVTRDAIDWLLDALGASVALPERRPRPAR